VARLAQWGVVVIAVEGGCLYVFSYINIDCLKKVKSRRYKFNVSITKGTAYIFKYSSKGLSFKVEPAVVWMDRA
jgi:hypothetical protein